VMMAWGDRWRHMAGHRCSRRTAPAARITPSASSAIDAASRSPLPTLDCASGTIAGTA
jgi:hypothetical protein